MGGTRSVRGGLLSGEHSIREVAAYLLDHDNFANVPATVRVEVSHPVFGPRPKIGSFQEFKQHDEEAGDVSASLFTVEATHKIAIMDIRLLNTDRNDANLLVKKDGASGIELIPIDHGCSLPDSLEVNWHDWAWLSWPQSKLPLSEESREYIARLDVEKDAQLLSCELNIRWQCLLVMRIATMFLQKGAAADLCLYDIASMMSRDEAGKPSALEVVFAQAKALWQTKLNGGKPARHIPSGNSPPGSPVRSPARRSLEAPRPTPYGLGSPALHPKNSPGKTPPGRKRSNSAIDLNVARFSLPSPEISPERSPGWADDDMELDNWENPVSQEGFLTTLDEMMDRIILRRQMKRNAFSRLQL